VNEWYRRGIAQVKEGEVAKVEDHNELGPDEVRADKEDDEGELEEVIQDEVASDAGSCMDIFGFGGEQIPDVADLEQEEEDPINLDDLRIQRVRCVVEIIDLPDGVTPVDLVVVRRMEAVVEASDNDEEP